jgi:c-di-GMP-binding flagellar brake protein YcgR
LAGEKERRENLKNISGFPNSEAYSQYKGPERRKYWRIPINFLVIYNVSRPIDVIMIVGSRIKTAVMLDLSEGGTAILTNYDIPVATILLLKFILVNTLAHGEDRIRAMEMEGETRYNTLEEKNAHRLGICFTQIDKEDRAAIANLVSLEKKDNALS